jgi:Zn-dependent M28 family amino/carboxypeptidase
MEHTRVLSVDIGRRVAGTEGEKRAAAYIEQMMRAAHLEVSRQEFTRADGEAAANIVGRIPGADYATGYFVIGGHYDTFGESPGGNDNGSGTAVVITLGELFGNIAKDFLGKRVPIEFVGFTGEELDAESKGHLEGSTAYARVLPDPPAVHAMLSIDMVGAGADLKIVGWREKNTPLPSELAGVAKEMGIPHEVITKGNISDHTPFLRRGIPALLLWSGDHDTIHKATDTFEVVQLESVDRAGRLTLEWLRRRNGL